MMRKKAQGLSLTTIVIAALAILVLVVLAVIFTGRIGKFTQEAESCQAKGGQCVSDTSDCLETEGNVIRSQYKCKEDTTCCIAQIAADR